LTNARTGARGQATRPERLSQPISPAADTACMPSPFGFYVSLLAYHRLDITALLDELAEVLWLWPPPASA